MFRQKFPLLLLLTLIASGIAANPIAAADRKPNVIIVLTDDQGTVDAACYGTKELVTPSIDALARAGTRFTQFYAAAPVCSPSRAALLTGRYPVRAGVPGNTTSTKGQPGMPGEQVTLGEMFKSAGYATAHIGKWHLGYIPEHMPNAQGFDHSFGHMGGCIDNYSHFFYWNGPNRHDLHRNGEEVHADGKYFPDLMVDEASKFIGEHKEEPFFIYFAMNNPHYPYQGEAEWLEHYKGLESPRSLYAAFLSSLDERIGRLMAAVDANGLREDTIVIFQSDHGHSTEERAHFGGGSAGLYRGAKFSLFEGGIRVPAIISWPGHIEANAVRGQVAHACDWMPTLAELCDVPLPDRYLDGHSLLPVLRSPDAASPHQQLHWMLGTNAERAQWAVREGAWKLIGNANDTTDGRNISKIPGLFLANLDNDPSETTNIADQHPDVVARLQAHHQAVAASFLDGK
ncbi:MAG: sulfatase-like hydrolase/transferase [Verrucomicrobiales bacterium]